MHIKSIFNSSALLNAYVNLRLNPDSKSILDSTQEVRVLLAARVWGPKIPKSIVDIKLRALTQCALSIGKDSIQILGWIPISKIIRKAVKRKVDLPKRRMKQECSLLVAQQYAVGHKEDAYAFGVANLDQLRQLGMNERVTHQMKTDLVGQWSDLFYDFGKEAELNESLAPNHLGTKAALEVADIADLNIDFRKSSGGCHFGDDVTQSRNALSKKAVPFLIGPRCKGCMKYWVFDLDGTLVDSFCHYFESLKAIFKDHDLDFKDQLHLDALTQTPATFFGQHLGQAAVPAAMERLQNQSNQDAARIRIFEGLLEMIEKLAEQGARFGVWTNRDLTSAQLILKQTGLDRYVEICVSGSCVYRRKPETEGLLRIIDYFKCDPGSVIVVGDHEHDVSAARAVGATAIRASWHSYWEMEKCVRAHHQFYDVKDFAAWITQADSPQPSVTR